jgi:hypothetical protein
MTKTCEEDVFLTLKHAIDVMNYVYTSVKMAGASNDTRMGRQNKHSVMFINILLQTVVQI